MGNLSCNHRTLRLVAAGFLLLLAPCQVLSSQVCSTECESYTYSWDCRAKAEPFLVEGESCSCTWSWNTDPNCKEDTVATGPSTPSPSPPTPSPSETPSSPTSTPSGQIDRDSSTCCMDNVCFDYKTRSSCEDTFADYFTCTDTCYCHWTDGRCKDYDATAAAKTAGTVIGIWLILMIVGPIVGICICIGLCIYCCNRPGNVVVMNQAAPPGAQMHPGQTTFVQQQPAPLAQPVYSAAQQPKGKDVEVTIGQPME